MYVHGLLKYIDWAQNNLSEKVYHSRPTLNKCDISLQLKMTVIENVLGMMLGFFMELNI